MIKECIFCGTMLDSDEKYICSDCARKIDILKILKRVDNAQERLEKMYRGKDFSNEADRLKINLIKGEAHCDSTPEIMVALQMEDVGLRYQTNVKIGHWKVDFVIYDLKIILEIDGSIYHTDEDKAFLRDRSIMASVGENWEIVHLEADAIPRYTSELHRALPYIVKSRNVDGHFRESTLDTFYLREYRSVDYAIRRSRR